MSQEELRLQAEQRWWDRQHHFAEEDFGDMVQTTTNPTLEDELAQFKLVENIEKQEEAMQKFAHSL